MAQMSMMNERNGGYERQMVGASDWFRLLSNRRTREVVAILQQRPDGVSLRELARLVVAREDESDFSDDAAHYDAVLSSLRHHHLPKLATWALVEYDDGTVVPTVRETLADETLLELALSGPVTEDAKDRTFDALASATRRCLIDELRNDGTQTVDHLAKTVAAETAHNCESAAVALHHVELPKLQAMGFIEYDRARKEATSSHRRVDNYEWLDETTELAARLGADEPAERERQRERPF